MILENQLKKGKISISDSYISIDKLSIFIVEAVKEQIKEEIRCVMDTYCGILPDDAYRDLETIEQETIDEIFNACGSYGMRD